MKKIISLLILFIVIVSLPLAADSDLAVIGMAGGYSSKDGTALLGFNGLYSYYASVDPSFGIGVGLDTSLSYFIGESKAVGFTVGATVYPQFFVFDDVRDTHFSIMANGYIGMALRFPASLIAIPVLNYILD